jgi:hypothetical protein
MIENKGFQLKPPIEQPSLDFFTHFDHYSLGRSMKLIVL